MQTFNKFKCKLEKIEVESDPELLQNVKII